MLQILLKHLLVFREKNSMNLSFGALISDFRILILHLLRLFTSVCSCIIWLHQISEVSFVTLFVVLLSRQAMLNMPFAFLHFEVKIGNIKYNSGRIQILEFSNLVIVKQRRTNYKFL